MTHCGYRSCNIGKSDVINVHMVSHTHDDVGWLKTVDQYYYGTANDMQRAGVRYILDSVVASLLKDEKRKFSYVEMAFFYMWWNEQSEEVKDDVKMLVNEGRLQFISGGWTMNDEATTHYTAIIDQMSLGLDFLNQTFGKCGLPLVGWQIDPFGHSIEQANLFAEFGFDGWFFTRLHYSDLENRRATKQMEFIQKTSYFNAQKSKTLFTSILYDTYNIPAWSFDESNDHEPVVDNSKSAEYNINNIAVRLMDTIQLYAKSYKTNNILIPIGGDFNHHNALHISLNLDKLIKYTNTRYSKDVFVFHSTPSCYLYAVNQANQSFDTNENDFFPYANEKEKYWTGYFSSRPTVKGLVRKSNNIFQICKKIYALSGLNNKKLTILVRKMAIEMGIMQHHDAITGTEKQHVTFDYLKRLTKAIDGCEIVINASFNKLLSTDNHDFKLCTLLNISFCKITEELDSSEEITVALFNPLGYSVKKWIRLPVVITNFSWFNIFDSNLDLINTELIPIVNSTLSIPERSNITDSNFQLLFQTTVPAMGYSSYKLVRKRKLQNVTSLKNVEKVIHEKLILENSKLQLHYSHGLLRLIVNKKSNLSLNVSQNIGFYYTSENSEFRVGAYTFGSTNSMYEPFNLQPEIEYYDGDLVKVIYQKFQDNAILITRLYADSDLIETEWTVGPLSVNHLGVDAVIHFDIGFNNSDTFYTDSNGRQLIKRQINKDVDFNLIKPQWNFYPIDSSAILFDVNNEIGFLIHTDRAQGGGATATGHFEVMVHRRILNDDGLGVGEILNELGSNGEGLIARGRHWFTIDSVKNIFERRRHDALEIFSEPEILFSKSLKYLNSNLFNYSNIYLNAIPKGLHILSFENHIMNNNEVDYKILRLENILHTNTLPIKVNIKFIFKKIKILRYEELNLSTNELLKNVSRLKWNEAATNYSEPELQDTKEFVFINPEQIRTFRLYI